jgi:putative PIN family toxin of toxin-antitoxin system
MLRIVVDPGVLVSARLSGRGAPAELVRRWLSGEIDVVASPRLLEVLTEVLQRPTFRRWVTLDEVESYLSLLHMYAIVVDDPPPQYGITPDPDDDYLVSLARVARVDALVSGDSDLTELEDPHPPVRIPREVVDLLISIEGS